MAGPERPAYIMSNSNPRIGICVYCGKDGPITDDHVPPKGIFAPPRPSNLITVPSCLECNSSASMDDEYFRIRVCLNDQARGHPDVNGNLPSVLKALTRPEASGLKQALLNDWRNVDVTTKGGIFLGRRTAFEVDMNRIARVVQRIVRGLYYHEVNTPLSGGVKIVSNENLSEQEPD